MKNPLRSLYDWVLEWAYTPYGEPALGMLSFAESSFFPIPPDALLIALGVSRPKRSFRFALLCSVASVLGGFLGYLIGYALWEPVGKPIINSLGLWRQYAVFRGWYERYDFWVVFVAGLTPIPYKVATITSGLLSIDLLTFALGSTLSRSARFFAEAVLLYFFGPPVKGFIEKYFNLIAVVFCVGLIGGFIVIPHLVKKPVVVAVSDESAREWVESVLESAGYEAVRESRKPFVVITDIASPRITERTPVIMLGEDVKVGETEKLLQLLSDVSRSEVPEE